MTKILCLILFFFALATSLFAKNSQVVAQQNDQYWISYTVGNLNFLMKIDSAGKVISEPVEIVIPSRFQLAANSISKNGVNFLNIWMVRNTTIYRAVVDQRTLKLTKLIKSPITNTSAGLEVTQKPANNFIVVEKSSPIQAHSFDFVAQGVSPTGVAQRGRWVLAANAFLHFVCCSARSVSSDGKTVAWFEPPFIFRNNNLSIRVLDDSGRPSGPAITLVSDGVSRAATISISNVLQRPPLPVTYIVYTLRTTSGGSPLFLQTINAQSGLMLGDRILLRRGITAHTIDPLGRFFLFTAPNKDHVPLLFFQGLDSTGHRRGAPKVLLKNVRIDRIDILKQ